MAGLSTNQKLQLGAEATPGSAEAATTIWRGKGGIKDESEFLILPEQVGLIVPTNRIALVNNAGSVTMDAFAASFEELPYIGMAGIKSVTPTADSGSGKIWTFAQPGTSVNTVKTYTIEGGDDLQAEEIEYCFVESFTLSARPKELLQLSATWRGRQVTDSTFTGSLQLPTVDEIQASKAKLYIDAVTGSFGQTLKAAGGLLEATIEMKTGFYPRFVLNAGEDTAVFYENAYDPTAFSVTIKLKFRHVTDANTEKGNWRSQTPRLLELKWEGPALTTPGTYTYKTVKIQAAGIWKEFSALGADAGESTIEGTFQCGYDPTEQDAFNLIVVNELAALP